LREPAHARDRHLLVDVATEIANASHLRVDVVGLEVDGDARLAFV